MKKGLKIAGAVAGLTALAALLPCCMRRSKDDETTVSALLWQYSSKPDPDADGCRKVSINIGFHNPFAAHGKIQEDESTLNFAEDASVCEVGPAAAPEETESADPTEPGDMTLEPNPEPC